VAANRREHAQIEFVAKIKKLTRRFVSTISNYSPFVGTVLTVQKGETKLALCCYRKQSWKSREGQLKDF